MLSATFTAIAACTPQVHTEFEDTTAEGADTAAPDLEDTAEPGETGLDTGSPDRDPVLPWIDLISPGFGPRGGGTRVELDGGGFTDDVVVHLDGSEARVVSVTADGLVVETPEIEAVGIVDLVVSTAGGNAVQTFRSLDFDDATGLAGAIGVVEWVSYLGTYWSAPAPSDYGGARWRFLDVPADTHLWDEYGPGEDLCRSGEADLGTWVAWEPEVSDVDLLAEESDVELTWSQEQGWFVGSLDTSTWRAESSYGLSYPGSSAVPAFEVEDFAHTPRVLELISPDLTGDRIPSLSSEDLTFVWKPAGSDRIVFHLWRDAGHGASETESVVCTTQDDGEFTVPVSAWSGWRAGDTLYVIIGAVSEGSGTLPLDNSDSRVAGVSWVIGAASTSR